MYVVRSIHVRCTQTNLGTDGYVGLWTVKTMGGEVQELQIPVTFYKPDESLANNDWIKEVLVQVIEQL